MDFIRKIALIIIIAVFAAGTKASSSEWALVRVSVACIRDSAGHENQLVTQGIMGMPLKIHGQEGQWYSVEMPDGYKGWVVDNSIVVIDSTAMDRWRKAPRLVVTALDQTKAWRSAEGSGPRDALTDLVNGNIVEGVIDPASQRSRISLPDGRTGWVDNADVAPIEEWAARPFDPDLILDVAYSMEGTPYLWGGTSVKSLDCSGLVKVCYFANGLILERDAGPQSRTGKRIDASAWPTLQPGDLLFFGNPDTGRVSHVAIYSGEGEYIHSSGRVKRNSIDPSSDAYLTTPFLHAARINGSEGTPGITRASVHPWYFNR